MEFEEFLRWNNINLRIISIASYIKGFAYFNGNEYLVLINTRCSDVQQRETIVHELIHIFENHFACATGYEDYCENQVHAIISEIKENYIYDLL